MKTLLKMLVSDNPPAHCHIAGKKNPYLHHYKNFKTCKKGVTLHLQSPYCPNMATNNCHQV